ncbi:MAG: SDR family NAD(P)-dependent oxidoreductase, partial [Neomegalonema sp.]|nr:SDR family NAD(P)-dependent oxidoreductase [Neomegalonema sp.]
DAPTLAAQAALLAVEKAKAPAELRGGGARGGADRDIAILSLAGRFPGASSVDALWRNLLSGRCAIRDLTDEELTAAGAPLHRPDFVRSAAVVEDADQFDPRFFGLSDREAELMDPQQRLFLECAREALEAGGYAPGQGAAVGVYAGCYLPSYLLHALGGAAALDPHDPTAFHLAEIGNDKDYLATRAAYLLGLSGPTLSIQTSCSTGLTAIAEAVFALRAGRCEMAIAGASSLSFPRTGYVHIDGHLTSASGVGRAFDSRADGAILGETVGAVLLKPLAQAQADGDPILAVIKGAAVNNDGGAKAGYSAPSVSGQAEVIQLALDDAGVSADTISYVEAHGTGTPVGDPIEVAALTRAFRRDTARTGYCALGSIKPNIGHGNIAAGFSGLAKAAMMLAHRRQPPMIGYEQPNPELRLEETPFHIATEPREWPEGASPRRAGVSSFGIGGANAHVILEEAPRQTEREEAGDGAQLFPLSARSETALARLADDIVHRFDAEDPPALDDASHTLRAGREAMPVRASFVVRSRADIRAACAKLIPTRAGLDAGAVWLFPGNGAQHPMMGADLYAAYPAYRQRFEHCRELFAGLGLPDLGDLYAPERSAALLTSAAGAQSALFAVELSLAALYESVGARPAAIVGHSLGEYAAWVAAGALSLEDGARLVAVRAAATDQAPEGGMMAVSADAAAVEALCRADAELVVAARNAPTEWTLSGPSASIEAALRGAEAVGASARRLRVQRAFHSPAMAAAAAALAQAGREVEMRSPTVPLASSLTGRWFDPHEVAASDYWSAQMRQPVLFADAFACALGRASAAVIEVGPGPSLAGLSAKNGGPVALRSLRRAGAEADHDDNVFLTTAGKLWAMGAPIELAKLHPQGRAPHRASMPTTPFDRRRIWPAAPVAPQPRRQGLIFTRPTWARAEAPAPTSAVGEWLILSSAASEPLAIALSEALRSRGALVRRGSDDLTELSSINARAAADPLNILDLTNATPEIAPPLEALTQLVERLQRVAAAMTPMVYWRVGAGALAVGLEEAQPDAAAALGPLLVAGQEHAMLGVRHIDLTPAEAARPSPRLCDQILRELLAGAPRREPFVALRGGRIWGERFEEVDPTAAQAAGVALLRQGGAHIITGGLGRIGLALTRRLAEHGAPVIVTTRRAPPDDWTEAGGSFAALAKLRESGANIRVVQLDLTRPEQVSALLRDVAVSGTGLGGVFHAAGLADLKYLPETDRMSLAAELASKRGGLQALNAAIETQRRNSGATPAFVMLFSSLAATLGGLGMAGYMAANRYMDAWVEAAADSESESGHPSPRWISVNWDDWDFDYGKEQVGAYARSRADLAMAPEAALNALEAILGDPTANRIAVSGSPIAERARDWLENASRILDAPSVQSPPSPAKRDMPAWLNPTETAVAAAYAAVLGAAELQPEDDFFDLGGDSLMATRIVMMLRRSLENAPPPAIADIFDYPTVRGLAARLEARAE